MSVNDRMNESTLICEALHDYLTESPTDGSICSAVREQLIAWITGEKAPEPMRIIEAPCGACNTILEALQSTITPEAMALLTAEVIQGNPLAIGLADVLSIATLSDPQGHRP